LDDINEFIAQFEGQQKLILKKLHNLISSYPRITAKIRYKIPFYYQKSWICYLNPVKYGGIELAFPRGNELSNSSGILDDKGRKQVRGIEYRHLIEIDQAAIDEILQEALLLDEQVKYASKRSFRK